MDPASVARRARGENFPVASLLFPRGVRSHLRHVYGYCRLVDILGDEVAGDRLALLDELEREVEACYGGEPSWPVMRELQPTIREFDRDREPFVRLREAIGGRIGRAVALFARGGLAALDALESSGWDVYTQRPKPSRARLAREAVATLVR